MEREILEGNKLIVEFMELKPVEWGGMYSISQDHCTCRESTPEKALNGFASIAKYHNSWDWLMPVVEKIHSIFESEEDDIPPYIYQCEEFLLIRDELCTGRLPESWKAVVEFIKWYNENNKTNDNTRVNN